jgi:CMP-N,N'-diacetyllegionaminic acid synthase
MDICQNEVWGFVPARGGSKTVPLKNLKFLGGYALIEYSIRAAKGSQSVSRYFVSTECDKIRAVAVSSGAEVDTRPEHLVGDTVGVDNVLMDFLKRQQNQGPLPEYLALLQPTSPFVSVATVDKCMEVLATNQEMDSVQSVCPVTHHNHAINQRLVENGRISFVFPELRSDARRKQDKKPHFALGNFIGLRVERFLKNGKVFGDKSIVGDVVNRYESIDIDTLEDFEQAEIYIQAGKTPKVTNYIPS